MIRGLLKMNRVHQSSILLVGLLILGICESGTAAVKDQQVIKIAGAYYLDSREFPTASIGLSANRLPFAFSLWGFTDFHGDHNSNDLALTRSFSEYRLSHSGLGDIIKISGLAFQVELNALSGSGNDLVRVGVTYKHNLPLPWLSDSSKQGWLQWRVFAYETDNNGGQASLIFNLPITLRIHVKGFADYNVIEGAHDRWVIEPELNVQLNARWWTLLEYRYNQYEDANPTIRGSSVALGLRYHFTH